MIAKNVKVRPLPYSIRETTSTKVLQVVQKRQLPI